MTRSLELRSRLAAIAGFLALCVPAAPLAAGDLPDAEEPDPFSEFSDELLIPETPYLFVNSVTLFNGYRNDEVEPGLGADEFDFYEVGLEGDFHWGRINLNSSLDFGWDGDQDADSVHFDVGVGYDFDLTVTGIKLTPLVGYHTDHVDRDSRYETEWEGPFVGARLEVPLGLSEKWILQASYFYHWADFEAELLAAVPAPVVNHADAGGHTGALELIHQINERVDLSLGAEVQTFSSDRASFTRREADWESWSVKVGVSIKF